MKDGLLSLTSNQTLPTQILNTKNALKNKKSQIKKTTELIKEDLIKYEDDCKAPSYELIAEDIEKIDVHRKVVANEIGGSEKEETIEDLKRRFIHLVSGSLIRSPNFQAEDDPVRGDLISVCNKISMDDPEFVLKVALYTRLELNIRSTSNFLLAYSSNNPQCRPFLKKYFDNTIVLPSDWISVAEISLTLKEGKKNNFSSLPASLRRVMTKKFASFNAFQLAKYDKDKVKSKKKRLKRKALRTNNFASRGSTRGRGNFRRGTRSAPPKESFEEALTKLQERSSKSFTLKQLIRKLHIRTPVNNVLCLLGKRYPENLEEFYKLGLDGTFDQSKCGKRMKLPTPETWETQISMKGNKSFVWEGLIDHKKLPFMAMLRNLRNLIKAGISESHHNMILGRLTDEKSIVNSKQFPFRFFSAYDVLTTLEKQYNEWLEEKLNPKKPVSVPARGYGRRNVRGGNRNNPATYVKKIKMKYDPTIISKYKNALDQAVSLATIHNVAPIKGHTIILLEVSQLMLRPCQTSSGLTQAKTKLDVGALLGLMFKYVCEECQYLLYSNSNYEEIELEKGTILENMSSIQQQAKNFDINVSDMNKTFLHYLDEFLVNRKKIDNIVMLSSNAPDKDELKILNCFLNAFRHLVNPDLMYVHVNLSGTSVGVNRESEKVHENDIFLSGYSDQLLRFVTERGNKGLLNYINKLDKKYNLPELKQKKDFSKIERPLPIQISVPRWKEIRVFISSTFTDMHGERDLLTRFIIPEIRSKAANLFYDIIDVDLRWGITESETEKLVSLCLNEVTKADVVIGLLGERYGFLPQEADFKDINLSDEYKKKSITEIEMRLALENKKTCFFYLRKKNFLSQVPTDLRNKFQAESEDSKEKMNNLKQLVKTSGSNCIEYDCDWGGIYDGKPIVTNLQDLGFNVLNQLTRHMDKLKKSDNLIHLDAISHETERFNFYFKNLGEEFAGRKKLVNNLSSKFGDLSRNGAIVTICGKVATGKSSLAANVLLNLRKKFSTVLVHSFGLFEGSESIPSCLYRICTELVRFFRIDLIIPENYESLVETFGAILNEISNINCSPVAIVFDDFDKTDNKGHEKSLNWLPSSIPQNVLIIFTVLDFSPSAKCLQRLRPVTFQVGNLDVFDKSVVVRKNLEKYGKSLNEKGFNNQISQITNKKDSNNPLYLKIACEELKIFGVFEQLTTKLKSLASTLPSLLTQILERLENEFGENEVKCSMSLLAFSLGGMKETDIQNILPIFEDKKVDLKNLSRVIDYFSGSYKKLPYGKLAPLLRNIKGFIRASESNTGNISLGQQEILKAISSRYTDRQTEKIFHTVLSGYCIVKSGLIKGKTECSNYHLSKVAAHLIHSEQYEYLSMLLTDLSYIEKMFENNLAVKLLTSYEFGKKESGMVAKKFLKTQEIKDYSFFVRSNATLLHRQPKLVYQQALNSVETSIPCKHARIIMKNENKAKEHIFEWFNKREEAKNCQMTIANISKNVTCLSTSRDKLTIICGSSDGICRLFDVASGKEIKTFIGHKDSVTAVKFLSSNRLCTAADDNTICIWDANSTQRLKVCTGHRRHVSAIAVQPDGKQFVSVGWDSQMKFWSSDGDLTWTTTLKKPINCVCYHPRGEKVVIGDWSSILRIYSAFGRKRIAILRGHNSAVRAVSYSPSGVYIASAALDGEVALWSGEIGSKLGRFEGHISPVNDLVFNENGSKLITVADDCLGKVWSGKLGIKFGEFVEDSSVTRVIFSPVKNEIIAAFHDGYVRIYDIFTKTCILTKKISQQSITCLQVFQNTDDITIACTTTSGELFILRSCKDTIVIDARISVTSSSISSLCLDGRDLIFVGTFDNEIICVKYNKVMKKLYILSNKNCHTSAVTGIEFVDNTIWTCSRDMSIKNWTVSEKGVLNINKTYTNVHPDWINSICLIDGESRYLLTSSNDFTMKMLNINGDSDIETSFKGHEAAVNRVLHKKKCIGSVSSDGQLKIWSKRGAELTTIQADTSRLNDIDILVTNERKPEESVVDDILSKDWSKIVAKEEWKEKHDQNKLSRNTEKVKDVMVVTASDDGKISIFKPIISEHIDDLEGHSYPVNALENLGNRVATSSRDGSVRIWTVPDKVQSLKLQHSSEISAIFVDERKKLVITGSLDGACKIWRLENNDLSLLSELSKGLETSFEGPIIDLHSWRISSDRWILIVNYETAEFRTYILTIQADNICVQQSSYYEISSLGKKSRIIQVTYNPEKHNTILMTAKGQLCKLSFRPNGEFLHNIIMGQCKTSDVIGAQISNYKSDGSLLVGISNTKGVVRIYKVLGDNDKQDFELYKKIKSFETPNLWLNPLRLCIENDASDSLMATDSTGNLFISRKSSEEKYKLHDDSITSIVQIGETYFTSSSDGLIRAWGFQTNKSELKGEFLCSAPVTKLASFDNSNERKIIAGDKRGNIYLLSYTD
ncbi:DgyrCDS8439 [Dimorphilus gyrociliatus]|uniref:DgyrCDS8439 n=1 Tax=Dimorphilus gyrociliatus TaxID=2664684 RepID=A0A7I8VVU9_9ANNE|nr:DgyrCDS8439 [Dimorphilus gyrociliatus]